MERVQLKTVGSPIKKTHLDESSGLAGKAIFKPIRRYL